VGPMRDDPGAGLVGRLHHRLTTTSAFAQRWRRCILRVRRQRARMSATCFVESPWSAAGRLAVEPGPCGEHPSALVEINVIRVGDLTHGVHQAELRLLAQCVPCAAAPCGASATNTSRRAVVASALSLCIMLPLDLHVCSVSWLPFLSYPSPLPYRIRDAWAVRLCYPYPGKLTRGQGRECSERTEGWALVPFAADQQLSLSRFRVYGILCLPGKEAPQMASVRLPICSSAPWSSWISPA